MPTDSFSQLGIGIGALYVLYKVLEKLISLAVANWPKNGGKVNNATAEIRMDMKAEILRLRDKCHDLSNFIQEIAVRVDLLEKRNR